MSLAELRTAVVMGGILLGDGMTLLILYAWTSAYIGSGSVLVVIDRFGEAVPELILWPFILAVTLAETAISLRRAHRWYKSRGGN